MTTPIEEVHRAAAIDSATTVTIVQNVANAVKNVPVQRWAMMRGARTAPVLRLIVVMTADLIVEEIVEEIVTMIDEAETVIVIVAMTEIVITTETTDTEIDVVDDRIMIVVIAMRHLVVIVHVVLQAAMMRQETLHAMVRLNLWLNNWPTNRKSNKKLVHSIRLAEQNQWK